MRERTLGREMALRVLYQLDLCGEAEGDAMEELLQEEEATRQVRAFAATLVRGVMEHREEIDREIQAAAENWDLHRMPVIDRNCLRMGVFELAWGGDVPPKVAINEAIDLVRKYSQEESGAFVNGILDKVRQRRAAP